MNIDDLKKAIVDVLKDSNSDDKPNAYYESLMQLELKGITGLSPEKAPMIYLLMVDKALSVDLYKDELGSYYAMTKLSSGNIEKAIRSNSGSLYEALSTDMLTCSLWSTNPETRMHELTIKLQYAFGGSVDNIQSVLSSYLWDVISLRVSLVTDGHPKNDVIKNIMAIETILLRLLGTWALIVKYYEKQLNVIKLDTI